MWRLVNALTWYLIVPVIGKTLRGNSESVLFQKSTTYPFPWDNLFASLLEFGLVVILVFYLNRWVQRKPTAKPSDDAVFSSTGEPLTIADESTVASSADHPFQPGAVGS
jgi:large-conductance mechanosensitive channel